MLNQRMPIACFIRDQQDRVRWEVDGRAFRLLGGEVHNSSGSSLTHLDEVLARAQQLRVNALLIPLSWELIEPTEGHFDLTLVDGILARVRQAGLRWVPLWFGAVKNSNAAYAPGWVKTDTQRFPRVELVPGQLTNMLSMFTPELVQRDARALAVVMRRLAELDVGHGTVIGFQPENEVGILGGARDRSPAAERAFANQVPQGLMTYLSEQREVRREVAQPWQDAGRRSAGTWSEVFGQAADEVFMAWHCAAFVGEVAAAGRQAYAVPTFANAWIVQHAAERPGQYPSGGPTAGMIDVWRAAAPAIEAYACDIYLDDFAGVCADYHQSGNPLLIPEVRRDERMAVKCWYAVGQHDCLAFAPFGIESVGLGQAPPIDGVVALGTAAYESTAIGAQLLASTYRLLGDMLPAIDTWLGTTRAVGILQRGEAPQVIVLGGYRFTVAWTLPHHPENPGCGGLIVSPRDGEFIVAGINLRLAIAPADGQGCADFLSIDEGDYQAGQWLPGRRLNGDEAWLRLGATPGVRQVRLYVYG